MSTNLLAVDGGQTGIKLRWNFQGAAGELLLPGVRTHQSILPQLAAAIDKAAQQAGGNFHVVAVGATGLTRAEHDAGALLGLIEAQAQTEVLLAHDSVTSYLAALADAKGAVVAAGTGVVTLAVGEQSAARVDGWGNIMGDAGSAYWIGQQVLTAVMRAHDGRGPATELRHSVTALWPDLEEAYIELQSSAQRVATVASFAKTASQLAGKDEVAAQICTAAAKELALSAATALERVGGRTPQRQEPVACLGGVFGSELISGQFAATLAGLRPQAVVVDTSGTGLDGAQRLASLSQNHPLQSLISRACVQPAA